MLSASGSLTLALRGLPSPAGFAGTLSHFVGEGKLAAIFVGEGTLAAMLPRGSLSRAP